MSATRDWSRESKTGAAACCCVKRRERCRGANEPVPSQVKPVCRSRSARGCCQFLARVIKRNGLITRTRVLKAPPTVFEVDDGHRIARDASSGESAVSTSSPRTALDVLGVRRIHVAVGGKRVSALSLSGARKGSGTSMRLRRKNGHVEPVVVVEVAVFIGGHRAGEVLACIVDVGRRVDDPQARRWEIASRRRRNLKVLHRCTGGVIQPKTRGMMS